MVSSKRCELCVQLENFLEETWSCVAWMPDELSPAHNIFAGEVRSDIAPLGKNYARAKADRPIKLSGRALYDDGQMINSNVINHVPKERLGWICFQQTCLPLESWDVETHVKEARGSSETSRVGRWTRWELCCICVLTTFCLWLIDPGSPNLWISCQLYWTEAQLAEANGS